MCRDSWYQRHTPLPGTWNAPYGELMIRIGRQHGFVLLPVVLAIALIAVIAFMLNNQSAINLDITAGVTDAARAEHITRAGLAHTTWGVQHSGCMGDMTMTTVPFGQGSYTATVATGGATTTQYTLTPDRDGIIEEGHT
ncbi:MAG: hypothetical protein HKM88_07535, partial [Halobacteria archaeon]|nr:hypothetical protein [Halobacteria archaeon]